MPTRPHIRRLDQPTSGVTKAKELLVVMVTLHRTDGRAQDFPGITRAWTKDAVLVKWRWPQRPPDRQLDWVPAVDIRREITRKARGPIITEVISLVEARFESFALELQESAVSGDATVTLA